MGDMDVEVCSYCILAGMGDMDVEVCCYRILAGMGDMDVEVCCYLPILHTTQRSYAVHRGLMLYYYLCTILCSRTICVSDAITMDEGGREHFDHGTMDATMDARRMVRHD